MNLFLDRDKADSVFKLLFAFAIDDACADEDFSTFESIVSEVLGGARVSSEVQERLRAIYDTTLSQPHSLNLLLRKVESDFSQDRDSLVLLLSILLRLSSTEGMLYQKDKLRLRLALEVFSFLPAELETLSDADKAVLDICYSSDEQPTQKLYENHTLEYYRVLNCTPENNDTEIRRKYRQLAKRYHPDKQQAGLSEKDLQSSRMKFEKIQFAYEQIKVARQG